MKYLILVATFLIVVHATIAQQKVQKYAVKSGHVEYKLTGSTTGIKYIWWDNYGAQSYTETKSVSITKVFGIKSETKEHIISIIKEGQFWSVNLEENNGQTGKIPNYQQMFGLDEMSEEEKKQFGKDILEGLGGEILGTEKVLDYECEIVELMGAKVWIYNGINLKSEAKILGIENNEIAIKFEKNISISSSKFSPPANINYQDISEQQQAMYGGMSDMQSMFNMGDKYEDDVDVKLYPVNYPFQQFSNKINAFKYKGYRKLVSLNEDGTYSAMFMKGLTGSLAVAATSMKNGDPSEHGNFETFTYKGKNCMLGKLEDDESSNTAVLEIPQYKTYIIIGCSPSVGKDEMIRILDHLAF
ncbi:hypothetical protein [Marinifilum flexuosum]|uniref:hypothetical protein n=1 Tax=Marinifilum flexuosum TaxID=1117708 RepID=UPI00248FE6AC|nr:hypothetical protein [Marinifilum flexuosum]